MSIHPQSKKPITGGRFMSRRINPFEGKKQTMKKLVHKFLENRCTPEEAGKVLRWLQSEEGEAFLKEQIPEDSELLAVTPDFELYPELDSAQLFEEIQKKRKSGVRSSTGREKFSGREKRNKKRITYRLRRTIFMAAAAVFLVVATLVYNLKDGEPPQATSVSYQVIETERGERKTVRLRDGSEVILNHDSSISIPDDFSESNRQLVLEGEAWFEVVPHASHPFIVIGSNSIIRVLGTSFMVESHPGEEQTRVVVEDGRVALGTKEGESVKEKVIEQNQSGLFVTGGEIVLQNIPDPGLFTGWKDGKLIFHNTSFSEVAKRLERWYDIDCMIADSAIEEEHFTSVFEDEPLVRVLDVIALSMNIRYKIDNRTVTFTTND